MAQTNKGLITGLIVAAFATTPVFLAPILRARVLSIGPHATFQVHMFPECSLNVP
jgi:hypothetical protein